MNVKIMNFANGQSKWHSSREALSRLWSEFSTVFPDETSCLDAIYKYVKQSGLTSCPYCFAPKLDRWYGPRILICSSCGKRSSLTTGTIFEKSRKVRPLFAAIWLTAHGAQFSSPTFRDLLGVAQSTALTLMKKVALVLTRSLLEEGGVLPASFFSPIICKRSRESQTNLHPRIDIKNVDLNTENQVTENKDINTLTPNAHDKRAASEIDDNSLEGTDLEKLSTDNKLNDACLNHESNRTPKLEETILLLMKDGKAIQFDDICIRVQESVGEVAATLTILELHNSIEHLPGDWYKISKHPLSALRADSRIAGGTPNSADHMLVARVANTHHGVSSKYLQCYLALVSYTGQRFSTSSIASLLTDCISYGKISYSTIISCLSSNYVKYFQNP